MYQSMPVFVGAHAMASHAGRRQALIARNIANADTPGYVPRDMPAFSKLLREVLPGAPQMRATRGGHLGFSAGQVEGPVMDRPGPSEPNGNAVSIETEMLNSVETTRQHDRALAIYRSAMTIIRISAGRV